MATLSVGQKAQKNLRFLMGIRNPTVAQILASHGFTPADLQEGWALLQRLSVTSLDAPAPAPAPKPTVSPVAVEQLDAWENKWFPIASATLTRRAPDVQAWLFRNLSQTQGLAVVVSVGTFVRRFELLGRSEAEGGMGEKGQAARELLAQRGLTPSEIERAEGLLRGLGTAADAPATAGPSKEEKSLAFKQVEAEMWAWYQEWSTVARMVIADRSLLRLLGIGRPGRPKGTGAGSTGRVDEPAEGDAATGREEGA